MFVSAIFDKKVVHHVMSLKKIHLTLLIAEVFLIFTMFLITSSTNESAAKSVSMLVKGVYSTLFWLGLVAVGLVIPILIEAFELFILKKLHQSQAGLEVAAAGTQGIAATLITESAVLAGGFILRYLLLAAAVPIIFI